MSGNCKTYKLKEFLKINLFRKNFIIFLILVIILIILIFFEFKILENKENQLTEVVIRNILNDFGKLVIDLENTYKDRLADLLIEFYNNYKKSIKNEKDFSTFFNKEKNKIYNLKFFENNVYIKNINYYFINKEGIIYKTDYESDLNLNLKKLGVWKTIFKKLKEGEPFIGHLSREYLTGEPRIFGYIKLDDNNFFEIGLKFSGFKEFLNKRLEKIYLKNLKISDILVVTYLEKRLENKKYIINYTNDEIKLFKKSEKYNKGFCKYISFTIKNYYYTYNSILGKYYIKLTATSSNLLLLFLFLCSIFILVIIIIISLFLRIKIISNKITEPIINLYNNLENCNIYNEEIIDKYSFTNIYEIDKIFLKYNELLLKLHKSFSELEKKHKEITILAEELKTKKENLTNILNKEKLFNRKIEQIITITKRLYSKEDLEETQFLKLIFRTIFNIIDEADYGSIYIIRKGKVFYIDTIGHNLELLNELKIKQDEFIEFFNKIKIVKNILGPSKNKMSIKRLEKLQKASKPIKQTLRLPLTTSYGIVSFNFDISENSKKEFSLLSIKILELFKDLLNIFYSIKESRDNFKMVLNSIGEGVIVLDKSGTISLINKSALEILDVRNIDFLKNKTINEILFLNKLEDEIFSKYLESVSLIKNGKVDLDKLKPNFYKFKLITNESKEKYVTLFKNNVYNNYKDLIGCVYILRDFTKEKELEEKYFQFQKFQTLGKFVGGILHDFNNLIGGISGSIELLKFDISTMEIEKNKRSELNEYIDMILESLSKGKKFVNNLKSLTVKESMIKEPVDLNEILNYTVFLSKKSMKDDINIKLIKTNLQYPIVWGNKTIISNILLNLISNAKDELENKENGKIEIRINIVNKLSDEKIINIKEKDKQKKFYKITVKDNGAGIPADKLDKIFEPFYSTKPKMKGSGLGLAIVKENVKHFDGYITVKSKINRGSEFSIYFPAISDESVIKSYIKNIKNKLGTDNLDRSIKKFNFKNKKVLIVDDEELVRNNLKNILQKVGFKVYEANNGVKGVKLIKELSKSNLDLIILDLVMPDINGQEVLDSVKNITLSSKIIISTGFSKDIDINNIYKNYKIDSILFKPYKMIDLLNTIKKLEI